MTVREKIQEIENKGISDFYIWNSEDEYWQESHYLNEDELNDDICDYSFIQVEILYSDSWGQYIPNQFYIDFKESLKEWNLSDYDLTELEDSYNEFYWDTWETVLNNAEWIKPDGTRWNLYQNGDLYAIHYIV